MNEQFPLYYWSIISFKAILSTAGGSRATRILLELLKRPEISRALLINQPSFFLGQILSRRKRLSQDIPEELQIISLKSISLPFPHQIPGGWLTDGPLFWPLQLMLKTNCLWVRHLHRKIAARIEPALLWLTDPRAIFYASLFPRRLLVFDAIDNLLHHPRRSKAKKVLIASAYKRIAVQADLIFTNTEPLAEYLRSLGHAKVFCVPNGIDLDLFKPQQERALIPALDHLKRPIVGYVGRIQERLDFPLLEYLLRKNPGVTFVLIGPIVSPWVKRPINRLQAFKNFRYLGPISWREMPQYLSYFDVGIVPHLDTPQTRSMDPLKTYEYLAMGLPVVVSEVAASKELAPALLVARSKEDFDSRLKEALSGKRPMKPEKVRALLTNFTWQRRFETMWRLVSETACGEIANG